MAKHVRSHLIYAAICAASAISATSGLAQQPFRFRFSVGLFRQSTAGVTDEGWTLGFHRSLSLSAISALELGIDFARVSAQEQVGVCEVVANNWCIASGGPRTALAPQLGLRFQSASTRSLRPFLTLGGATILSLDDPTSPPSRPALIVPQIQAGLIGQRWAGDVRLRGLRKWESNVYRQVALHIAVLW